MDLRDQLVNQLGGEVVQPQKDKNIVDLGSNQGPEPTAESQTPETSAQEGSSLNTEEANAPQPEINEGSREMSEDDVFKYLSEQLGKDISSLDDLKSEPAKTEEFKFASEKLKVINDYIKDTGRTVEDYLNTQTVDLSNISDDVLLKEYLKVENPDLTEAELNDYMMETYKLSSEEYSDREVNVGKVQLKKDAKAARDYFNKVKEDYALPVEGHGDDGSMSEQEKADWVSNMTSSVDDMDSLSFSINDQGEEFTYSFDDTSKGELKKFNSNLEGLFDKYIGDDGKWDFDSLNKDMYILNNIDKIVRSVANQYKSKGTENVMNEIKNPSFSQDKQSEPQKQESTLDMLRRQILG